MNVSADHTSPSDGQRPGQPAGRVASVLLDEDLTLRLGSRVLAAPVPGQALVRVEWAGVCGSDLHVLRPGAWASGWPATLGHEVAGGAEPCPARALPPRSLSPAHPPVPLPHCD